MKAFRPPKREKQQPGRPLVQGYPTYLGMHVTHPKYGEGRLQWCEFRLRENNEWVPPLERDADTGRWVAVVSQPFGSYMAPNDELTVVRRYS